MSIHFQLSRIHSSFVKGRSLAESHEVNSRVLIDRSEARISFSSLVETLVPMKDSHLQDVKLPSRNFTHLAVIFHKTYETRTLSHLDVALMQSKLRKNQTKRGSCRKQPLPNSSCFAGLEVRLLQGTPGLWRRELATVGHTVNVGGWPHG